MNRRARPGFGHHLSSITTPLAPARDIAYDNGVSARDEAASSWEFELKQSIVYRWPPLLLTAVAAFALACGTSLPAARRSAAPAAPTFNVNSIADVPAGGDLTNGVCETATGNGICTLRAAVMKANHFPGGGATINVPSGTYAIPLAPTTGFNEADGAFYLQPPMTIVGAGAASPIIDGNGRDRVFNIYGFAS